MPWSGFFSVLWFSALVLLGVSSAFVMLDADVTLIMDSEWGGRLKRHYAATAVVFVAFLCSLPYCTEFGYYYLDAVDRYISRISLVFVVWIECVGATTIYRHHDVVGQVGQLSFIVYNAGYLGGQVLGVFLGHVAHPVVGAAVGFGIYFSCLAASIAFAKRPNSPGTHKFFAKNKNMAALYYLVFYSVRCHLDLSLSRQLLLYANLPLVGQSTSGGPQCHYRPGEELEAAFLLGPHSPLYHWSHAAHHSQLVVPGVRGSRQRPPVHLWLHRGTR